MLTESTIITPKTSSEIKAYYGIRFAELRKPWGQPRGSERDSIENQCVHRMIVCRNNYIGVAR